MFPILNIPISHLRMVLDWLSCTPGTHILPKCTWTFTNKYIKLSSALPPTKRKHRRRADSSSRWGGVGLWFCLCRWIKEQPDKGAHCVVLLKTLRVFNICIIMKRSRERGLRLRKIPPQSERHLSQKKQNKPNNRRRHANQTTNYIMGTVRAVTNALTEEGSH